MALGLNFRHTAESPDLESHQAGHALLVHHKGALDGKALAFARRLPRDPDHHVVVLDLPAEATEGTWHRLARMLRRRAGGFRLIAGRGTPRGIRSAGQWLADRLERTVVVADGAVVPVAGGLLYVPGDTGSGWVRLGPNLPAAPLSRRFPAAVWEFSVADRPWRTSPDAVVDPLPSGVWLRPDDGTAPPATHQARLETRLAYRRELLTVVLGCPGAPPLSLDDVARFWQSVLPGARSQVRFVPYGPVDVPPDGTPGQLLAERLDCPVVLYNGMPTGQSAWEDPQVHALDTDGQLGWTPYARELRYLPARMTGGRPEAPRILSHRAVAEGLTEISPGVYRYADDAVVEVVPSGLWMRPPGEPAEPGEADAIRSAAVDPRRLGVVFGTVAKAAGRMRELAENLLNRLDPESRGLARLLPAAQVVASRPALPAAVPPGRPAPGVTAPVVPSEANAVRGLPPAPASVVSAPSVEAPLPAPAEEGRPSDRDATSPTLSATVPADVAETPEPAVPAAAPFPPPSAPATAPEPARPGTGHDGDAAPARGATPPGPPVLPSLRLVSAPGSADRAPVRNRPAVPVAAAAAPPGTVTVTDPGAAPATAGAAPTPPQGPAPRADRGPAVAEEAAATGPRPQPTPAQAACALPPPKGLAREREWLRTAFRHEHGDGVGAVARVLSQAPGLRGTGQTSTDDVITDLVAVRLYLRGDGRPLHHAVREATVGPHVPLARCVTAGLRRLPSYRGATMMRASLGDAGRATYASRRLHTEWAFCWALSTAAPDLPGDTTFLIWSMTARRTALLEPESPHRVIFLPGTSFKVLDVRDGERPAVLLRELPASEIAADGRVDTERTPLDDIALAGLRRAEETWQASGAETAPDLPASAADRFGEPPGLILATPPAVPDPTGGPGHTPGKRTTP
ncbi:hypothetical protein GCM10010377_69010 [Streptomyces viridiviolaceus]|uniref:Uncharacterized protein n=1 Tax=Streptomyces viridiviolaceus TaxID=68282 RepID=A0ABW2EDA3_9ACTN|nr:hypothetical protein [Streptomyces viridiviolaceus]GHB68388.1 hypothetical protein GCM10010377_69010 [Streptomyces viridiviolaceus]